MNSIPLAPSPGPSLHGPIALWSCWLEVAEAVEAELRETTLRFVQAEAAAGLARYPSGNSQQMSMPQLARSLWERAALRAPLLPLETAERVALVAPASFDLTARLLQTGH